MGKQRTVRFTTEYIDNKTDNQEKWNKIMEFLKRELRVKGEMVKNEKAMQYFMMKRKGFVCSAYFPVKKVTIKEDVVIGIFVRIRVNRRGYTY